LPLHLFSLYPQSNEASSISTTYKIYSQNPQ
jgi:hypothetical protein